MSLFRHLPHCADSALGLVAFGARLEPVTMRRRPIVDRGEIRRVVVVTGLDVVNPIGSVLAAEVADLPVSGEHELPQRRPVDGEPIPASGVSPSTRLLEGHRGRSQP